MKSEAIILRTIKLKEHDLLVELMTKERGRLTLRAFAARKSRRRFGGALEIGTHVRAEIGPKLRTLNSCDILGPLNRIRGEFERFQLLNYILEVARLSSREDEQDEFSFILLRDILRALEEEQLPEFEFFIRWELALLSHLGYGLRWSLPFSVEPANALSLMAGGAIRQSPDQPPETRMPDATPLSYRALSVLESLSLGQAACFDIQDLEQVRRALIRVWEGLLGRRLRSASFLLL